MVCREGVLQYASNLQNDGPVVLHKADGCRMTPEQKSVNQGPQPKMHVDGDATVVGVAAKRWRSSPTCAEVQPCCYETTYYLLLQKCSDDFHDIIPGFLEVCFSACFGSVRVYQT